MASRCAADRALAPDDVRQLRFFAVTALGVRVAEDMPVQAAHAKEQR